MTGAEFAELQSIRKALTRIASALEEANEVRKEGLARGTTKWSPAWITVNDAAGEGKSDGDA